MIALVLIGQAASQTGIEKFAKDLTSGIALGAIYALLALGFVIIFKATQVVNFAHGAIAALGAYFVVYFAVVLNVPGRWMGGAPDWLSWSLSALIAVLVTALIGIVIERLTIRPMIGEPLFAVAMITLGLDLIIRTITNDLMDNAIQGLGDPWGTALYEIGPLRIAHTQVVTVGVLIAAVLMLIVFFRSRTGVAVRATAFDQEAAMAQGINVGRVFAIAWGMGVALAALAAIMYGMAPFPPGGSVSQEIHPVLAFRVLPVIVLGGLDSAAGAVYGGLIIASAEVFAGQYLAQYNSVLGSGYSTIVPYIVMLIVLLVRPYGLFGTPEIRRV